MSNYPKTSRNLNQSEDGWTPPFFKSNKGSYSTVDPAKLKLTKPDEVESIRIGPGGRGLSSWGRKVPDEINSTGTKRYSALDDAPSNQLDEERRRSQSLLETIKVLTEGHDNKASEVKKQEVYFDGKSAHTDAELVLNGRELDEEEMNIKTKNLLKEFVRAKDFDKTIKSLTEFVSPSTVHLFINSAIYEVFGMPSKSRKMFGQLLWSLVEKNIITFDHYKEGFEEILKLQKQYFSEVMQINKRLGEMLVPLVKEGDGSSVQNLKDVLKPCMEDSEEPEYGRSVATYILQCIGIPEKLEFTLCPTKLKQTPMTYEEMKKSLLDLLRKSEENEEIFDWIHANVGDLKDDFIRALVTAVHEDAITVTDRSCKLDTSRLKKRCTLLTRYISGNEKLEMQALYAIQYLMNKLGHPTWLLHQIFNVLYDDDVITEDAFKKWEQNDLDETEGKGVAVHSTRSFFTWLRESESGGEEDATA